MTAAPHSIDPETYLDGLLAQRRDKRTGYGWFAHWFVAATSMVSACV